MSQRILWFLLYVGLGPGTLLAQTRVQVLDAIDERPVPQVLIGRDGRTVAVTDSSGFATIPGTDRSSTSWDLQHLAYHDTTVRIVPGRSVVRLMPRSVMIGAVTVGRPLPETVYLRPDLHAADLLINEQGLWVLAYARPRLLRSEGDAGKEILRDTRLVLLNNDLEEVASCPVPEDVFGLRHDFRQRVVIEGTRRAFGVRKGMDVDGDPELFLEPFTLEELRKAVLPWTDSIPGHWIGSNVDPVYPAFDHLAYDPVKDSGVVFCSVVDTFMMQLFRSEYKYLRNADKVVAMNLAADLGVDKEVAAGYMRGFQHNIWFKPVYAPLFVVGDTMLVLDHARGRMRKFDRHLGPCGDVSLSYLRKDLGRYRVDRILQDRATQRIYALFARHGRHWVREVDPHQGTLGKESPVTHLHPERVQVYDGSLYYIHRPYESLQKRAIYRERLR